MTTENRSLRDDFTNASAYNQLEFIIERKIREMINTAALVRVDSCTSDGPHAPAGTVTATPLVSQVDAEGNALPMAALPRLPHYRAQAGIAALILDPVPGDIGVACFCKSDSSTVRPGATEPRPPASWRAFDMADGMLAASVSNQAPEVWIELRQDKTIIIHAPEGCVIETETAVTVKAPEVTLSGNLTVAGNIATQGALTAAGEVSGNGITLSTHTHGGVETGPGSTGAPH